MCGLAGIYSHKPVATELYDSLIHLQHRGQDAAGITTYNKHMHKTKGLGLVRDIFTEKKIKRLKGNIGIAHTRYPTHGGFGHVVLHPVWTSVPYGIALAHNGNLTNYNELAKNITKNESRYLNTNSDTEVLLHLFAELLHDKNKHENDKEFFHDLCSALENIYEHVRGAYSVLSLIHISEPTRPY